MTIRAVVQLFRQRLEGSRRLVSLYALLPGILYLGLMMTSHLNVGVRHLLPLFPFAAMLAGGLVVSGIEFGLRRNRILGLVIGLGVVVTCGAVALFRAAPLNCGPRLNCGGAAARR